MFTLENYLPALTGSLTVHAALTVYLFVMMDMREALYGLGSR